MAQQQARDEAGNIWNIDEAGNPVSLASAAPQGGASVVASNPVQAARQSVDLSGAQLGNQKTAQQIALEAAQVPYAPRQAAAETAKAETDAEAARVALMKAQREAPIANADQNRYRNLQNAIDSIKTAFAAGPLKTSGISGLRDFLPSDENRLANDAGNAARALIGPALNLTASQLNTPGEVRNNVEPYIPNSWDTNAQVLAKIQRIQGLADAMGGIKRQQQTQNANQQTAQMASGGGGPTNPQQPGQRPGYAVAGVGGGVGGGGGGGTFASAAGVAMAQKMKAAYNRGAGVAEINSLLQDNGFQPLTDAASIAAIQKRGPINFAPPQVDDTRGTVGRALGAAADSGFGAYAINAADALTAGNLDSLAGGQAGLALDYTQQQYPGASLAGTVTGGALAAGGAELGLARAGLSAGAAALGGDALYGAAYGAGSSDDGNRLLGAAVGAGGGLLGGAVGRGAVRGAGKLLGGVQNADVRALREAGIPTTVGQTVGGPIQRIENSLSSIPFAGDMVNSRYREGIAALRPAAVREAVQGVPNSITATGGREALEQGRAAVGNAYDGALNGVNLNIDPAYKADLGSALTGANSLPGPLRDTFTSTLQNRVAPQFNGQAIDGRGLQAAVQGLRKDSGDLIRRGEIQSDLFADRATDVEEALFNLAERQVPGTPDALIAANRANRGLSIVEEASARALNNGGDFTAAQLGQSIRQNSRRFNGVKAMNSGKAPLQALQEAAQRVLPSSVPDSGTAGRAVVASGLGLLGGAGIGGGGGYVAGDTGLGAGTGIATAALLAAGGSKTGQRLLVKGLADRPDALVKLGDQIQRRARIGGLFGAPLLAGAAPLLAQ